MASLELITGAKGGEPLCLGEEEPPRLHYLLPGTAGAGPRLSTVRPPRLLAAFLLAGRRWLVLDGGGAGLRVNGYPVPALKVLDHGDVVEVAGWRLRLDEEVEEVLVADSPLLRQLCPVCLEHFLAGESVLHCPIDKLAQHTWCWEKNRGRCAAPRCRYVSRARAAGARVAAP
jgi:hypothetical protein